MSTRERHSFDPSLFSGLPGEATASLELAGESETLALGMAIGQVALEGGLAFLGLVGDLGAGKTTLIKGLSRGMNIDPRQVSSPTYALVQEYGDFGQLVHMDLYRLEHYDDLESLAYWDYIDAEDALVCVEWLDRIPQAWPGQGLIVALSHAGQERRAQIFASTGHHQALVARIMSAMS
ncbi:tRNA (adenosine(37)-N6)-threonylcarbamoyltransferase complex ATPase subunit type 1 TsaE [Lujinxingia litoralis]|uniref:tRNA threonylcarbamoyladenosine biosynthesis protein TsaE n=1 Tax=Lujinxingia litoralis TaxID=2211119 RepID=A0A328C8W5_9DELT|nr:tRNA (adenosine(37)-N6)-threonylcarbamoyltransferase complex ATPase subunit type 1 TsaE [Lujinxingia litoralis]RAL23602.1 tRNA (adenosine(37)-N6)-threonylcarbamoyltransferase complex ATPase subunit type 1 TsaE [Lujinxingia litoralis]